MKYEPGDKIRLKRTGEEGTLRTILDKEMVEIEVGGVLFPVFVDELEHPYLSWFAKLTQEKQEQQQKQKEREKILANHRAAHSDLFAAGQRPAKHPSGVHLAILPEFASQQEDLVAALKIYLVHHLDQPSQFSYTMAVGGAVDFQLTGSLMPGQHLYLHRFDFDLLNEQPRFPWGLQPEGGHREEQGKLRLKPKLIFDHVQGMQQGKPPLLLIPLVKEWTPLETIVPKPQKALKSRRLDREKPKTPRPRPRVGKPKMMDAPPKYELDLHMEALLPGHRGMSAAEMLRTQLRVLEKEVHYAIAKGVDRMYIIHGIGKGVLRHQVHQFLSSLEAVKSYQNDWHPRYGYGATEVIFHPPFHDD